MHYVLNFLDTDRQYSHCIHMDCKNDRQALALVELVALEHEMELRQGPRVVRGYKGKPLSTRKRPSALSVAG
jgi:hypothetical protein